MDFIIGCFVVLLLVPFNLVFLKIGKKNIYTSIGSIFIMLLGNILILGLYTYGLIDDISSVWKFVAGLLIGIMGNLTAKIWYVYE